MSYEPNYELLVTAVSERADLFAQSMDSLLAHLDLPPSRVVVHEDVRPGSRPGAIAAWLIAALQAGRIGAFDHRPVDPARGMGPAMLWCFERARTPLVVYTQEDWEAVRPIPVRATLALMERHGLNHVRWNKRKTMRAKHDDQPTKRWAKVEVQLGVDVASSQTLCISDHWYTQTSVWRRDVALPGLRAAAAQHSRAEAFVAAFNTYMNRAAGLNDQNWQVQQLRHERVRTYIWGPIGEPAFIRHLGTARGTGNIRDHRGA